MQQQMKPEMGTRRGGSARGLVMVTQHLGKGGWGRWGQVAAGIMSPVLHNPLWSVGCRWVLGGCPPWAPLPGQAVRHKQPNSPDPSCFLLSYRPGSVCLR